MREISRPRSRKWPARFGILLLALCLGIGLVLAANSRHIAHLPRFLAREAVIGLLWVMVVGQLAALLLGPVILPVLAAHVLRARRRGRDASFAARVLLLGLSTLVALGCAELGSRAYLRRVHRFPSLPTRFPDSGSKHASEILIAVIGESSARGQPYDDWLSMPAIVAWQLGRVFPDRRVSVQMLAQRGTTLELAHQQLTELRRRPDAIFVYAGHNEFQGRFSWGRNVRWYVDASSSTLWDRLEHLGRSTSLGRVLIGAIEKQRLDRPPPPTSARDLIDVPVCTDREARELIARYGARLDAIGAYCRAIGAVPIIVVPASNEGDFEPNRSSLPPEMRKAEREGFRRRFQEARDAEARSPQQAPRLYKTLVQEQPGFAETHFRLARLLFRAGDAAEAVRHFRLARDCDGMPLRAVTGLQEACRAVAIRSGGVLVDGPTVLSSLVPDGVLDDRLFHDAHHPNLVAYIALAQDVLAQLKHRGDFGWPAEREVPIIDPDCCAMHFGVGRFEWASICRHTCDWFTIVANVRYDPSQRMDKALRLAKASFKIAQGVAPEACGVRGYGTHPAMLSRWQGEPPSARTSP